MNNESFMNNKISELIDMLNNSVFTFCNNNDEKEKRNKFIFESYSRGNDFIIASQINDSSNKKKIKLNKLTDDVVKFTKNNVTVETPQPIAETPQPIAETQSNVETPQLIETPQPIVETSQPIVETQQTSQEIKDMFENNENNNKNQTGGYDDSTLNNMTDLDSIFMSVQRGGRHNNEYDNSTIGGMSEFRGGNAKNHNVNLLHNYLLTGGNDKYAKKMQKSIFGGHSSKNSQFNSNTSSDYCE